ncbi:MAG: NfeD family protein [Candidatus Eisenbacteria bacterium]|uniref:NfeD family protein n=1 Tax=Eiseniibacteriota bacterium TaxID=2212470 RepID=A0A9D6QJE3_UNCEI|nr:NfeD family protein [Candidatus Eisenbacteria bacterium]MBI3539165.1 NfeD family protein [Candidatus Eisenbacteria bacterium]
MNPSWNWVLIVAGALFVLVEVAFGGFAGFDLVLIGSAFVLGGLIGLLLHSPAAGFMIASVLCVGYIAIGRRWVRARMQRRVVPTNVDALLGQRALVTVRVAEHEPGQVRVRDEVWRAVPASGVPGPFEAGALVTVESVEGVTLQVR